MKQILMIDEDKFSYRDIDKLPLGGTMSGFTSLVKAFEQLGHKVTVRTGTTEPFVNELVSWQSLTVPVEKSDYDLFIVNRFPRLFNHYPAAKKKVLWMRNTGKYLFRWRQMKYILTHWPDFVFTSRYHKNTYPFFMPGGRRHIVPHGLDKALISACMSANTSLRVAFTSNPLRSLDWLVDIWQRDIHPQVPEAELHVFSGFETYGDWGKKVKHLMDPVLDKVTAARASNVILRKPLPKEALLREISTYRGMFYRGDAAETFCFAIAESQALGVPCVVQSRGCMDERIVHGKTGFVEDDDREFARRCVEILRDDALFAKLSAAAKIESGQLSWADNARQFLDTAR